MSYVGIVYILFGALIAISRGLIVVAPATTLKWFKALISTESRVKVAGLSLLLVPALFISAGITEESVLAQVLLIFGLFILLFTIPWLVIFPRTFMDLTTAVLPSSLMVWRLLGLIGVVVGLILIYLGWGTL